MFVYKKERVVCKSNPFFFLLLFSFLIKWSQAFLLLPFSQSYKVLQVLIFIAA